MGVALDTLSATGMAEVERHNLALRDRFYRGLTEIPSLTLVSICACRLQ